MPIQVELTGKTAIVTGGASGIGEAIARALSENGAKVLIGDINRTRGQEVADSLDSALFQYSNLSTRDGCRGLVDRAFQEWGGVDILVNDAGIQHVAPIEDFPEDKWEQINRVMLVAPALLIKYAIPSMYEKRWGRIINIASAHGLFASAFKSAYVSAKHGLLGLTKTIALEAAAKGVTVNAICPGYVRTPLVENQMADQMRVHAMSEQEVLNKVMLEREAIKRLIEVEEVAAYTLFLCSEYAKSITGCPQIIDGGWSAH